MSEQPVTIIRASALSGYADCPRRSAARMFRQETEAAEFVSKPRKREND